MSRVFVEVFNLSLAASWLIAAVVIVRALISRRMPKWICCCMWGLVAIRLLVPFTVQSDFSLVPDQELVIKETSPEEFYNESLPAPSDNSESGHESLPEYSVQPPLNEGAESVPDFGLSAGDNTDKPSMPEISGTVDNEVSVNDTQVVGQTDKSAYEWGFSASTARVLSYVWVSGLIIMLSYAVISSLLLKRRVALSVPCGDGVRKGEGVDSPFVFGIFRPRIYIPYGLGGETEKCVIAHERAHLKRGDHLIKPLGFIILSVYWFNPLVWVAYVLLCRDIEYACDEKVIKGLMPEARKAYALALLDCAVAHKRIVACPVAFGETGVKERVKKTMNYKRPAFWIILIGVIACVIVGALFLTTNKNDEPDTSDSEANDSSEVSTEQSDISQEIIWNTKELDYIDNMFAAQQIDYEDIGKYAGCYRFTDDDHSVSPILFIPKDVIYNVKIFTITDDWADISDKKIEKILYETEKVTDAKPLLADIKFIDSFAVRGISFTDENGNEHFYEISDSAVDGSLLINKFENADSAQSEDVSTPEASEPEENQDNSNVSDDKTNKIAYNDAYYYATMNDVPFNEHPRLGEDEPLTYVIRSYHDYVAMEKTVSPFYKHSWSFDQVVDKLAKGKGFETNYFDDNAWLVTFICIQDGNAEFSVGSVYFEEDELVVDIHYGTPKRKQNSTYKSVCVVAEVDKTLIKGIDRFKVKFVERDYNDVADLSPFVENHQTPENLSELKYDMSFERLLKVKVMDAKKQVEEHIYGNDSALLVKQAGLKVWILDANDNKLDYVYTNSQGIAAVVVPVGEYHFYFEGTDEYAANYSNKWLRNGGYYDNIETSSETALFTYPTESKTLTIYVTDAETGEPVSGVKITGFGEEGGEVYTDKNGIVSMDSLLTKYSGSGTWFTFTYSHDQYDDIQEKVHIIETELHVQLTETKMIPFTIKFVDYETGKPVSNVRVENCSFEYPESEIYIKNTQNDGIISGTMNASERASSDNCFKVSYGNKSWNSTTGDAIAYSTIYIPTDDDSYEKVIKVRIKDGTISFVNE